MDKWKDIELEKIRVGGNRKARNFFATQESWNDSDTINKRYNSFAAALYRNKITTLAEGKDWDINTAKRNIEKQSKSLPQSKSAGSISNSYDEFSYQNNKTNKQIYDQKEQFFDRIQNENAMRPDHLPPSQGGRYAGFGNQINQPPTRSNSEFFDTTWTSLSSGWSVFSSSATKIAQTAKDNALKYGNIATQKVKESNLLDIAGKEVTQLASKVSELGKKSLFGATSYNDIDNQQKISSSGDWTCNENVINDNAENNSYQNYDEDQHEIKEFGKRSESMKSHENISNDFQNLDIKANIKSKKRENDKEDDLWDMLNN